MRRELSDLFHVDGSSDGSHSEEEHCGSGVSIYLEVDNVDELAVRLHSAAIEVTGPSDEPWGERVAYVQYPDGYSISLSKEI